MLEVCFSAHPNIQYRTEILCPECVLQLLFCTVAGNKLSDNVKALMPFLIANFIVLGLVTYVPFLTTGVASLVLGG